jgi:urease accessory protein
MHAQAAVATEYVEAALTSGPGQGRTRVCSLRSQSPLMLRLTRAKEPDPWTVDSYGVARVCVAAGAAGPIGGDRYALDVDVGAGSTLVLGEVAPTLLLPGPHGEESRTTTTVHVGEGASFVWLPEPVIAAQGCRHRNEVRIDLDDGARLLLRDEVQLGRHDERPGTVDQRVRIRLAGRPLYDQELRLGPDAPGWDSPAVIGRHQAIGSMIIVDPVWNEGAPPATLLADEIALLALSGPAVAITALSHDSLALRRSLTAALQTLGPRWDPYSRGACLG